MTTETLTLTDFLLACIAEDETEPYHRWDCDRFNVYDYATRQGECDCGGPARVLAECEAKRRIVGGCDAVLRNSTTSATQQARTNAEATLRLLALPYADRPGYRQEWRP